MGHSRRDPKKSRKRRSEGDIDELFVEIHALQKKVKKCQSSSRKSRQHKKGKAIMLNETSEFRHTYHILNQAPYQLRPKRNLHEIRTKIKMAESAAQNERHAMILNQMKIAEVNVILFQSREIIMTASVTSEVRPFVIEVAV